MRRSRVVEAATDERRGAIRQSLPTVSVVIRHGDQSGAMGLVTDLSRSGALLTTAAELACGDRMVLDPPEGSDLKPICAEVVRDSGPPEHSTSRQYGIAFREGAQVRRHQWWLALRLRS